MRSGYRKQRQQGENCHGSRNSAVDARGTDSDHSVTRYVLSQLGSTTMENTIDPVTGYSGGLAVGGDKARSAVSWAAIAAGAVVAASTSLLLIALGGGVGLASLSPWTHTGASVGAFTAITAMGLIVVQWVSSGVGGYIAGRLRTRWIGVHTHEVFFRDTAHGFITWATATLLASAAAAVITGATAGAGLHAASSIGAGAAMGAASSASSAASVDPYDVDTLLRPANPSSASSGNDVRAQTTRILARGLTSDDVSADDRTYLAQIVSAQAGVCCRRRSGSGRQ